MENSEIHSDLVPVVLHRVVNPIEGPGLVRPLPDDFLGVHDRENLISEDVTREEQP